MEQATRTAPRPSRPPVVALIPLRTGGKSRLGLALPPHRRDALVLAMLDDVVTALRAAGVSDVRVLAGDGTATAAAAARGLPALPDPVRDGVGDVDGSSVDPASAALRAAVDAGLTAAPSGSIRLVVVADLPRLAGGEVLGAIEDPADVVVVPTRGGGTAMLRLAPGIVLPVRYGPDSARAHADLARQRGHTVAVIDLPSARHDVDAARDLEALRDPLDGSAAGSATAAFLGGRHR